MRSFLFTAAMLILAATGYGQAPQPVVVQFPSCVPVHVVVSTAPAKWVLAPAVTPPCWFEPSGADFRGWLTPGNYGLFGLDANGSTVYSYLLQIGGTPIPPGPNPPPVPPVPPIPPNPPMPVAGLYVMGVVDQVTNPAQYGIVQTAEIRALLDANCAKDPSGSPAYRWFAPTSDLTRELPVWQDAMKIPHPGVEPPYWVVSNGKKKWVEAWPSDIATAKARITEAIQGMK